MASEIAKAAIARITKNQAISAKILIAMMDGIPVDQAIDRVLGAGTWKKLTSELYDELRKKDRASRPGAPDTFAVEDKDEMAATPEEQMRDLISKIGQKPDSVNYKWGAFELHYYGREGKGDGEARARRTLSNLHGYLRRTGIDTHAAYVQPIDPRDPSRGSMIIVQASAFDKFSRPGAPDTFAVEDRFYFGKGRKERFEKEYVLWGLPKGETDRLHEKVLYTQAKTPAQMEAAKRRAAADGWHSFRVQILDLSKPFRWPV